MRWAGMPGQVVGGGLLLSLVGLGLAAWPSAFIDRGASGNIRTSVLPLALTLFDPLVWTSVVNSLVVTSLVAAGSLVIGVGLAVVGSSWRFRGGSALWILTMAPLVASPLLLSPAIGVTLGGGQSWDWLAARSVVGYSLEGLVRWAGMVWVGLAVGAPMVALATSSAFRKIEPAWLEAARGAGASRSQIWREIVWPNLRGDAARASAAVFTLTLVEPASPLILGRDRTLAWQILDSAQRFDQPTRTACLALLAIAMSWVVTTLIGWWGGPIRESLGTVPRAISGRIGFRRAMLGRLLLIVWAIFTMGPLGLLLVETFRSLQATGFDPGMGFVRLWLDDSMLNGWALNSLITASSAVLIGLLIVGTLLTRRSEQNGGRLNRIARFLGSFPPLALGVGGLATPWLLDALSHWIGGPVGSWVGWLARELSPARSPGFALILVVAALQWPTLLRVAERAMARVSPDLVDASRLMGVSDRRAARDSLSDQIPARVTILILILAATNLAPALLISPFSERRPLAPAIIDAIVRNGAIEPRIAAAIIVVLLARVIGFALASRTRVGTLSDWFRG